MGCSCCGGRIATGGKRQLQPPSCRLHGAWGAAAARRRPQTAQDRAPSHALMVSLDNKPPCPSKTPKNAVSGSSGSEVRCTCASSICTRHPCGEKRAEDGEGSRAKGGVSEGQLHSSVNKPWHSGVLCARWPRRRALRTCIDEAAYTRRLSEPSVVSLSTIGADRICPMMQFFGCGPPSRLVSRSTSDTSAASCSPADTRSHRA